MKMQQPGRVNIVLHLIGSVLLKLLGWKVESHPPDVPRYVVIVAPHTSNWDFPMALLISWKYRMKGAWLGKASIFNWPLIGWFFSATGGIPVDRSRHHNLVGQAIHEFSVRDNLIFALAPEGTRAKMEYWKSGFYHVACAAGVPVALGYLDFKRKAGGFGPLYACTGNVEQDLAFIRDFYATITPRHPERRTEVRFRSMPGTEGDDDGTQ